VKDLDRLPRHLPLEREPATALFGQHVPGYLAFARHHRGRRSTGPVEWALRKFFAWLEGRGVVDLAAVTPLDVRDFLSNQTHLNRSTIAGLASVLRPFLRYLNMRGVVPAKLAELVESPRQYRMSTPPPVLAQETVELLLGAVDRTTELGKRDYAMLLLAARYGLRPSDIRGLRFEDIHWREQRIVLLQAKTQRPLELPLLAEVDEALVDYLRHGRPACDARQIFVRHRAPVAPISSASGLWEVMERAFAAAHIEPPKGPRGLCLLRHTAATRMLSRGVPFKTISDVLGHASTETTRVYAQVELAGLRSVALSTEEVRG
jgi:site-specific recombinase XerD